MDVLTLRTRILVTNSSRILQGPFGSFGSGWGQISREAPLRSRTNHPLQFLPFLNIGGDPEQEHFSDGTTEDMITALSRLRWFFVIGRNSSFAYKAKAIDIKRVARELGVRYVLEGSVRKGGNRVRMTSQLIEAATGNHIWAERYDGDLTDVFACRMRSRRKSS